MTNPSLSVAKRVSKGKEMMLEQLKKVPIIQVVCEKSGISRATYYRWRIEDNDFAQQADMSLAVGRSFINDLAESQLLKSIQNNDLTAIIFWLKHNHKQYGNRLELSAEVKSDLSSLSKEQEDAIKQALELASLTPILEVESLEKSD